MRSVELLPSAAREIKGFSTGMITRLGLAAALMNDPDLLVFDEPTAGLDPAGRRSTLNLIEELGKEKTIFVSSHILSDIDRMCTHVGIINEGRLIFSDTIKKLKKHIKSNLVRLELDGNLELFCEKLRSIEGIINFERRGDFTVDISFDVNVSALKVIKEIISLVSKSDLDLISINSSPSRIEDAFLRLLEEEESHGFVRAIKS